jgi:hypothetical protein
MKIVREYIEYRTLDFERSHDPYKDLRIGNRQKIERWLEEDMNIPKEDYRINSDLSIDVSQDINLMNKGLYYLPDYIKFNTIHGGFYAAGNHWQSLDGFPKIVYGDFQIRSISSPADYKNSKKFTDEEIKEKIMIYGKIYN